MLINYYPIPLHFDRFVYPGIQNLNFNNINIVCNTSQFLEEPYSTENLHSLSGHLKFLSEPTPLTAVNFNDVQVRVQAQYRAFAAVMKPSPIFLNLMVISLLIKGKQEKEVALLLQLVHIKIQKFKFYELHVTFPDIKCHVFFVYVFFPCFAI